MTHLISIKDIDYEANQRLKEKAIQRQSEAYAQVIPYEAYKKDNVMTDILRLHCASPNYSLKAIVCNACSYRDAGINIIWPCNTVQIISEVIAKAYGIEKELK